MISGDTDGRGVAVVQGLEEYVAIHPEWGKIIFNFEKDKVTVNFVNSRYTQALNKGTSFWQK